MTSSNLNYSFNLTGLSPNTITVGVRALPYDSGGHDSVHSRRWASGTADLRTKTCPYNALQSWQFPWETSSPMRSHFAKLHKGGWLLLCTPQRKNFIHWRLHLTSQGMFILLSLLDWNVSCETQICKRNKHRSYILMDFGFGSFLFPI